MRKDKDIRKLKRVELFEIMVNLKRELETTQAEYKNLVENYERLRRRLDEKDEKIRELKGTLQKERDNREILLLEAGNIAEASLRLNHVFEAAQSAADQYLENLKMMSEGHVFDHGDV